MRPRELRMPMVAAEVKGVRALISRAAGGGWTRIALRVRLHGRTPRLWRRRLRWRRHRRHHGGHSGLRALVETACLLLTVQTRHAAAGEAAAKASSSRRSELISRACLRRWRERCRQHRRRRCMAAAALASSLWVEPLLVLLLVLAVVGFQLIAHFGCGHWPVRVPVAVSAV